MTLSLSDINKHSPYRVAQESNGNLVFKTRADVVYSIGFIADQEIAGSESFQFFINRSASGDTLYDPFVKDTIFAIIEDFFDKNNDIMLYICDTSDGRESARNRLFVRWFREYDESSRFEIRTAEAQIEHEVIYAAIIVKKTHPNIQNILMEFDYLATNITSK